MIEPRRVAESPFASRERAEVTLNSIGDAERSTDLAGAVTYLNLAAEAMTGWSREAAAGRPLDEVFHIITRQTREVARILRDSDPDPRYLELELTEDILMQDMASAVAALHALKGLGAQVAVEHFGTGHSSWSDLEQFPIDLLKVDQSFVREIVAGTASAPILATIIGLGKNLNHRVMASGVETDCQLAFLRAQHCPEARGDLFSPPVDAEQFGELLATGVGR